jgi:hypothetical protein
MTSAVIYIPQMMHLYIELLQMLTRHGLVDGSSSPRIVHAMRWWLHVHMAEYSTVQYSTYLRIADDSNGLGYDMPFSGETADSSKRQSCNPVYIQYVPSVPNGYWIGFARERK